MYRLEPQTQVPLTERLGDTRTSALSRYQEVHIGSSSIIELLRYEAITTLLSGLPGAVGYLLRKFTYPSLLARAGQGLAIGPHVTIRCPSRISLGDDVLVDGQSVLDAKGRGSLIRLGNSVLVGKGSILSCGEGAIEVGSNVTLGPNCYLRAGLGPVTIGSDVTIGAQSILISGSPDYGNLDIPMHRQVGSGQGVEIGSDVWIGVGVRVVDGVTIGDGSVVGAGSVVLEDVSDYDVVAGVPAKILASRK